MNKIYALQSIRRQNMRDLILRCDKMKTTTHVQKRTWDRDDTYLVIEVQVDSSEFKNGDEVKVTIEKV